ncbi:hypothetical protein [Methanobrevibacter sp.]|nr:hypothetical protein [Methanobrevibacter sp.]MDO5824575.1 hypothetical protein [Methanobrevibacter sp.]
MSNKFPTTDLGEFIMFLVTVFFIGLGMYGVFWLVLKIIEFLIHL